MYFLFPFAPTILLGWVNNVCLRYTQHICRQTMWITKMLCIGVVGNYCFLGLFWSWLLGCCGGELVWGIGAPGMPGAPSTPGAPGTPGAPSTPGAPGRTWVRGICCWACNWFWGFDGSPKIFLPVALVVDHFIGSGIGSNNLNWRDIKQ